MQTGERNQVNSEFSQIGVKLTGESQAASHTRHRGGDEMVKIAIGRGCQLKGSEANIVQSFVIDDHAFIRVFDELMN